MEREAFLRRDNWAGFYYELALRSPIKGDLQALQPIVAALWSSPELVGPWQERENINDPPRTDIVVEAEEITSYYGILHVADRIHVGCHTSTFDEPGNFSWLSLCIPSGMLGNYYQIRYPLDHSNNPWLQELDAALLRIAVNTFRLAPYQLGLIGEEILAVVGEGADASAGESLLQSKELDDGGVIVTSSFLGASARAASAEVLAPGLLWFPRND